MKARLLPFALIIATIAVSAIFVIPGCQKSVGPFDPSTATYQYNLKGQVVDARTNAGIPSATVKVFNKVYTTDINGYFSFRVSYATVFPFEISAEAPDYLLGSSVVSGSSQVRAIRLTSQNPEVILNETGGTLKAVSAESFAGKSFELVVPAGALNQTTSVSLTPMEEFYFMYEKVSGLQKSNQNLMDLATISIAPAGLTFNKPVTLFCPLPFANDKDTRYPLLQYDMATASWIYTGNDLVVDASGTGGIVTLAKGGIYSVAGQGMFSETKQSESVIFTYSCGNTAPYIWQAGLEQPSGVPGGVSQVWLKNIISHNTVLGGHVSFIKETSSNIVCESYQPGSSHPVPSEEINLPAIPNCPSGTNALLLDNGVFINKRVIEATLSFTDQINGGAETITVPVVATVNTPVHSYSWQCLHDQGGGKK